MKRIPEKENTQGAAARYQRLFSASKYCFFHPPPPVWLSAAASPRSLILRYSVSSPTSLYAFVINSSALCLFCSRHLGTGAPAAGEGRLALRCKVRPGHLRMPMHLNEVCLSCWPQRGEGITAHFAVLRCPISFGSLALTSLNLPVARC